MFKMAFGFLLTILFVSSPFAQVCLECHKKVTPGIVNDWQLSKHSKNKIGCAECHGSEHKSRQDVAKAKIPTPDTCATCHDKRVKEFKAGKHALAWAAMKAMPTAHWQPMSLMEGMKGCGGCHKIGLKSEAEIKELKKSGAGYGVASCDACHTLTPSPSGKRSNLKPARPATWDSITPNGRCIPVQNMGSDTY